MWLKMDKLEGVKKSNLKRVRKYMVPKVTRFIWLNMAMDKKAKL